MSKIKFTPPWRIRVLDWNTPWFWFTVFYEPFNYGEAWLKIEVWSPHKHCKWWLNCWRKEQIIDTPQGLFYSDGEPKQCPRLK